MWLRFRGHFLFFYFTGGLPPPPTPHSELSRFAPGPRALNSQEKQHAGKQNHQKSNQEYKNNGPKGAGAKRPPPSFCCFIIPDCFSDDFACRHVVFVANLRPWARRDPTGSIRQLGPLINGPSCLMDPVGSPRQKV